MRIQERKRRKRLLGDEMVIDDDHREAGPDETRLQVSGARRFTRVEENTEVDLAQCDRGSQVFGRRR